MMDSARCEPRLSIVVPVLDDDECLDALLLELADDAAAEVIVVDGADRSSTRALVENAGRRWLPSDHGRGAQIATGVDAARGAWIWVLHADSTGVGDALRTLRSMLAEEPAWGRFDVFIPGLPVVARLMNLRSRITKICTGDQAMFFHRTLIREVGGFPPQPLMEDIEVSRRLKLSAPHRFVARPNRVTTSSRRWRRRGVVPTILTMWWYRLRYFFGVSADRLYQDYYGR